MTTFGRSALGLATLAGVSLLALEASAQGYYRDYQPRETYRERSYGRDYQPERYRRRYDSYDQGNRYEAPRRRYQPDYDDDE